MATGVDQGGIRDLLFGDVPLEQWSGSGEATEPPWTQFDEARSALSAGNPQRAIDVLRQIVETPDLESRHYVQAWNTLRECGVTPGDDLAKRVLGIVLEVPVSGGHDVLAAYADYSARYLNFSGAAVIWQLRDAAIDAAIERLLAVATEVVAVIGPWDQPRLPDPPQGVVRFSMLTPSGLHFGEGPFQAMSQDPMGAALLAAGAPVVELLVAKAQSPDSVRR